MALRTGRVKQNISRLGDRYKHGVVGGMKSLEGEILEFKRETYYDDSWIAKGYHWDGNWIDWAYNKLGEVEEL